MSNKASILFVLLTFFSSYEAISQDEFFHELSLEKSLVEKDEWELTGEVDWKNLYNESGWKRWGAALFATKSVRRLHLQGGLSGYYTFNKSITNFFELRPWAAIGYDVSLISTIKLRQRLKGEWRLFYDEGEAPREHYRRIRYHLGLDIPLWPGESEDRWKVRPYLEWYFIRDPATYERFPNERDYGFTFIRQLENEHELSIGYKLETFYNIETERGDGHLFIIGYSL